MAVIGTTGLADHVRALAGIARRAPVLLCPTVLGLPWLQAPWQLAFGAQALLWQSGCRTAPGRARMKKCWQYDL